jgi:hypothetical protein
MTMSASDPPLLLDLLREWWKAARPQDCPGDVSWHRRRDDVLCPISGAVELDRRPQGRFRSGLHDTLQLAPYPGQPVGDDPLRRVDAA